MDKYTYGSSAYKIEDDIYTRPDPARERQEKRAERRKAAIQSWRRLLVIFGIIAFVSGAGIVYSNVLLMQAATTVEEKTAELVQLRKENDQRKIEIEQSIDLKKVEELAITKYGMQRRGENQIVKVNVVQKDYGEVIKD